MSTVPIVLAIVSLVVFKERINVLKMLGIVFSMLGAWIVISKGQIGLIFNETIGLGELYLMLCVFCAAGYALLSKHILNKLSPLLTMAYVSAI